MDNPFVRDLSFFEKVADEVAINSSNYPCLSSVDQSFIPVVRRQDIQKHLLHTWNRSSQDKLLPCLFEDHCCFGIVLEKIYELNPGLERIPAPDMYPYTQWVGCSMKFNDSDTIHRPCYLCHTLIYNLAYTEKQSLFQENSGGGHKIINTFRVSTNVLHDYRIEDCIQVDQNQPAILWGGIRIFNFGDYKIAKQSIEGIFLKDTVPFFGIEGRAI